MNAIRFRDDWSLLESGVIWLLAVRLDRIFGLRICLARSSEVLFSKPPYISGEYLRIFTCSEEELISDTLVTGFWFWFWVFPIFIVDTIITSPSFHRRDCYLPRVEVLEFLYWRRWLSKYWRTETYEDRCTFTLTLPSEGHFNIHKVSPFLFLLTTQTLE